MDTVEAKTMHTVIKMNVVYVEHSPCVAETRQTDYRMKTAHVPYNSTEY